MTSKRSSRSKGRSFTSAPQHYNRNYEMGKNLRVVPAEVGHEDGSTPGAAIFCGPANLVAVITAEHAWRLTDQLVDVLDALAERPSP